MKVFCERCGNAHDTSICCRESDDDLPQGQANGRERSAYVQLPEVRALIEKIEEVQEIMDTAELSLISASSLDKMVEMVRIKNDLKQKLSEHFG